MAAGLTEEEATFQGDHAGFASRLVAFVIDLAILNSIIALTALLVSLVLGFFDLTPFSFSSVASSGLVAQLGRILLALTTIFSTIFLYLGYPIFFWTLAGKTPGKALMGLQVVTADGSIPTFRHAFLRAISYWLSAIALFAGFLWVIIDEERQGWHDHIAGTYVIYAWEAREAETLLAVKYLKRRPRPSTDTATDTMPTQQTS